MDAPIKGNGTGNAGATITPGKPKNNSKLWIVIGIVAAIAIALVLIF